MTKKLIIFAAAAVAGYFLANKVATYPGFSQAYDFGAGIK